MSKIRRAPKKENAVPTHRFETLKKGDAFRNIGGLATSCPILVKMEDFYTEEEELFNAVDIMTGKEYKVDLSTNVIKVACFLEHHDEVA